MIDDQPIEPLDTRTQPAAEDAPAERAALRRFRAKLLDLSKRNRLLNFITRSDSVSTIAIVDEIPAEVFRILVKEQRSMRFKPAERSSGEEQSPLASSSMSNSDSGDGDLEVPLAYDDQTGELAAQYTDTWLQTRLNPERLDRVLRRIADKVELIREEQGVNTLFLALGMLRYFDAESSEDLRRAPLLLVPVELKRSTARTAYQLSLGDDDIVLNPALIEQLRQQFGITLPSLPDDPGQIEVASLFATIQANVSQRSRWKVTNEIAIGSFSFLKHVMYKDLETNEAVFAAHRLFKVLLDRSGQGMFGLPDDIKALDLDAERPPEATYEVLNADSSQQRAVAAVAKGYDLVVEGPPGTGKSQTIVNLIANALGAGRTVLFVSEKRAALEVVQRRLQAVGLGGFCLELHSQKARKREVVAELQRSLDHSLDIRAARFEAAQRLPEYREKLTRYATAVHRRHEPIGLSVFEAVGRLADTGAVPTTPWLGDPSSVTREAFEKAESALASLADCASRAGGIDKHPWLGTSLEQMERLWGEAWKRVEASLNRIASLGNEIQSTAATAAERLGVTPPRSIDEALEFGKLADLLATAPGAPIEVLTSPEWNKPPAAAEDLLTLGRRASERRSRALTRFHPQVLDRTHAAEIAIARRYYGKAYRMLVPSYRRVRRAWIEVRRPTYHGTISEQADHLREIDALGADLARLEKENALGLRLFGSHWRGLSSDWSALARYIRWVVEFRTACVRKRLKETEVAQVAAGGALDVSSLQRVAILATELHAALAEVGTLVGWPVDLQRDKEPGAIGAQAQAMLAAAPARGQWVAYLRTRAQVEPTVGVGVLRAADAGDIPHTDVLRAFRRSFFEAWLRERMLEDPTLRQFEREIHEQDIEAFRRWDAQVLAENRQRLAAELAQRVQASVASLMDSAELRFLQGQFARQRGHAPVRKLLRQAFQVVRAIKPCFMMSPLMVAQCLEPGLHDFDVVIFDEASQLTPEDAIGGVVRGKQLVVVGDPKQLPPTTFFNVEVGLTGDGEQETDLEDLESVLELYEAAGLSTARLRWHYRSAHESLIAFSNANIYEWDLLTFPCADAGEHCSGLIFRHVPQGMYLGSGLNLVEARRVADAVVEHARQCPDKTLGVGTFNLRQQLAVQDELERRRREDPTLEDFFRLDKVEPFFVKNLENIQGDERDVIFLSVTYARAEDGIMRHNFGPINGENGWRRLNVLITRARERLEVFSSMRGDEIDITRARARGAQLLRDFLLWCERRQLVGPTIQQEANAESPFEREVAKELTNRGLRVVPQVGVGRYRIDIGVLDDEVAGRFICGIECDGAGYHQSETARDRDRLREEVLRRLGWRIHRVWSTDWFKFRQGQVERLLTLVDTSRQEMRSEVQRATAPSLPAAALPSETTLERTPPAAYHNTPLGRNVGIPETRLYSVATVGAEGSLEDLLVSAAMKVGEVMVEVLEVETPIHEYDLFTRVAKAWGVNRIGRRVEKKLRSALEELTRRGAVSRAGEFTFLAEHPVQARSRAGTGIPPERIAPEEYRAAVLEVLASGPRTREDLVSDARSLLGFDRTGTKLDERISWAIDALLSQEQVGVSGTGLALRQTHGSGGELGQKDA